MEKQGLPEALAPYTGPPRVPVATDMVASRIAAHFINTEAPRRLVRVGDGWVTVYVAQGKPVDVEALGRQLGVLEECEAMV